MKRTVWIFLCLMAVLGLPAQTQQGIVKTRGRMANGQLKPGQRLQGAVVRVKGRSAMLTGREGKFSFPLSSNTYQLLGVEKQGYELVDREICRSHLYSPDPLYVVMDTPEQQFEDQLAAEKKIRNNLQQQLARKQKEIAALNISLSEKKALLSKLSREQAASENLVADMAERYATMDYDQMNEFYRQVSACIEQGMLARADSLLRSKGDLNGQAAQQLLQEQEVEKQKKQLEQAQAVLQRNRQELASRCMAFFDSFSLQHQNDSAAHYIDLRASLDTTCVEWQFQAANYHIRQNNTTKAEQYFQRILRQIDAMPEDQAQEYMGAKAATFNNLAMLCEQTHRSAESCEYYEKALAIRMQLAVDNPDTYRPLIAQTQTNLGMLYAAQNRMDEAEDLLASALDTLQQLAIASPQKHLPALAATQSTLATLYMASSQPQAQSLACQLLTQALIDFRLLAANNPQRYRPDVAATQSNLAMLYYRADRQEDFRVSMAEAISIYMQLVQDNPQAYTPSLATLKQNLLIMADELNNRGVDADGLLQPQQKKECYESSLAIYRAIDALPDEDKHTYVARQLGNLAFNAIMMKDFTEAENFARQGLQTEPDRLFIHGNLALALMLQGKQQEAEDIIRPRAQQLKKSLLEDLDMLQQSGIIDASRQAGARRIREMLE